LGVNASHGATQPIPDDRDVNIAFDATSAYAHDGRAKMPREAGRIMIDLTPAARGSYVIPPVKLGRAHGRAERRPHHLRSRQRRISHTPTSTKG